MCKRFTVFLCYSLSRHIWGRCQPLCSCQADNMPDSKDEQDFALLDQQLTMVSFFSLHIYLHQLSFIRTSLLHHTKQGSYSFNHGTKGVQKRWHLKRQFVRLICQFHVTWLMVFYIARSFYFSHSDIWLSQLDHNNNQRTATIVLLNYCLVY